MLIINTGLMVIVGLGTVLCIVAVRTDCDSMHYLATPMSTCPDQVRHEAASVEFIVKTDIDA